MLLLVVVGLTPVGFIAAIAAAILVLVLRHVEAPCP